MNPMTKSDPREMPSEESVTFPSKGLRNLSFRTKLLLYGATASLLSLLLAMMAILFYDTVSFRQNFVDRISSKADILSQACGSAIAFGDAESASKTITGLGMLQDVLAVCVYDEKGAVFAEYRREGVQYAFPSAPPAPMYAFRGQGLDVFRSIVFRGNTVGMIHLRADPYELSARFQRYLIIALIVLLVSLGATVLLSIPLQTAITKPLLELGNAAEAVSRSNDYSMRVPKRSNDELGVLADTFNEMVKRIRKREAERDRAEAALVEHRGHLEALVAGRTAEIETRVSELTQLNADMVKLVDNLEVSKADLLGKGQELEAANKELEAFSYSVSHDLRAPLRSIHGFSAILMEDYREKLGAEGLDYLERVCSGAEHMGTLIDDMLILSRISRREMNSTSVDLSALAEEVLAELLHGEPGRAVELGVVPGIVATGDPNLLRVVLVNLLGNAWKFTGKTENARIEFGTVSDIGDPISERVYFVRDNGAGFDMRYIDKLFVAFNRLHKPADFPGTGIGLATVQRVIHRHHGRLWAEAEVDKGATFYFTLGA